MSESVGTVNVTVGLDAPAPTNLTIPFMVSGSASFSSDHDAAAASLFIGQGSSSGVISFNVVDDIAHEAAETVILSLQSGQGYNLATRVTHTVTISASDIPSASMSTSTLSSSHTSITSGSAASLTLTLRDSGGNPITFGGHTVIANYGGGTSTGNLSSVIDNGDGTYSFTFTGLTAGSATTVSLSVDGLPLSSTLPNIQVIPGVYSLAHSTLAVSSASVNSGSNVGLTLTLRDANNNILNSGGPSVAFSYSGGSSTGSISGTTDNSNGTYSAIFTGAIAGTATTLSATINSSNITSTLPTVTVNPGPVNLGQSTITASSASVNSGSSVTLTVTLRDTQGNQLSTGGKSIVFSTSGGTSAGTLSGVTDHGDGTYSATLTGTSAGSPMTIGATVDSSPVTSTLPTLQVTPGPYSPANSTLTVSSGTVGSGSVVTVTLTLKDANNNNLPAGGQTVAFSQSGGSSTGNLSSQADLGNGTHTITFEGLVAGTATTIGATVNSVAVTSTLPTVTVTPGPISLAHSVISVSSAAVSSGSSITLFLAARDANNNSIQTGGETVLFSRSGGTSTGNIGSTTDQSNGTYTATFSGLIAGTATTIQATIGGQAVTNAPPTVTVVPGAASTANSIISISSSSVAAGNFVTLTLTARDSNGNNLTSGGLTVAFSRSGGSSTGSISSISDLGNGQYTATFTGQIAGSATNINATIGGSSVTSGSPTVSVFPGPASASESTISVSSSTVQAGSSVTITLTAKDAYGNNITAGGASVSFNYSGGQSTGTIGSVTDNSNGSYTSTFQGALAGSATTITGIINSQNVTSTLPSVTVNPGPISAAQSKIQITAPVLSSGQIAYATLYGKDAAGNAVTSFGASVDFSLTGGSSNGTFGSVTDNLDGTYTAAFTASTSGSPSNISATVNGGTVTTILPTVTVVDFSSVTVQPVFPTFGATWMEYVRWDDTGSPDFLQDETACDGSEMGRLGRPGGCIHTAEKLKVVLTGLNSCKGVSVSDSIGLFDWRCEIISGTATFLSKSLKPGNGLRSVVNSGGNFNNNYVNIVGLAGTLASTSPSVWWSGNYFSQLSASSSVQNLGGTAGTIYYTNSNLAVAGLNLTANQLAVVTLGTAVLSYDGSSLTSNFTSSCVTSSPTQSVVICGGGRKFLWIEAEMDGGSAAAKGTQGVLLYNTGHSRIHSSKISMLEGSAYAIEISPTSAYGNIVSDTSVYRYGAGALKINGGNHQILDFIAAKNFSSTVSSVVSISGSGHLLQRLRIQDVTVAAATGGIILAAGASNNVITDSVISNINGNTVASFGIKVLGDNNIVSRTLINNTNKAGIGFSTSSGTTLSHSTFINNKDNGIYFMSGTINTVLGHSLAIVNHDLAIAEGTLTSATGNRISRSALIENSGGVVNSATSANLTFVGFLLKKSGESYSGAASEYDVNIANGFVGKITDDSANLQESGGQLTVASFVLDAWKNFENPFRSWARDHADALFSSNHRAPCTATATCQIWDFRLKSGSPLVDRAVDGQNSSGSFAAGASCPAAAHGNEVETNGGRTFLRYAVEINDDYIGNDNGLCESSEACLFAPNIGAYQGHGDYSSQGTCIFQGGSVSGVQLYAYPTLAVP